MRSPRIRGAAAGRSLLVPAVCGLVALATYLPTVAPTITWLNGGADGGDLAAAVLSAGIPHPPGYPTYLLLALLWAALPLPGDLAHRLALLSAVGAALGTALTVATISRLASSLQSGSSTGRRPWTGAVAVAGAYGGLILAWSPLLWSQAAICEVYAPGLVWVALVGFLLLAAPGGEPTRRRAALAAFVGGLGFGALPQIALAGPGALAVLWIRFGRTAGLARCLVGCALAAGLGLLTLLYLPLRAAADPPANWGDPSSLDRFVQLVTAAEYRYVVQRIGPAEWLLRLREGFFQLGRQVLVVGVLLALLGARACWRVRPAAVIYLVGLAGLTLVVRAAYPVEGNLVYLIPALYALAILAGLGLAWLLGLAVDRLGPRPAYLLAGAGLALAVAGAVLTMGRVDASDDWTAATVAQRLLDEAPPGALLLSRSDEITFALWYTQATGQRRDVVVVDERLLVREWYRDQLARRHPDLPPTLVDARAPAPGRARFVVEGPPPLARLRALD